MCSDHMPSNVVSIESNVVARSNTKMMARLAGRMRDLKAFSMLIEKDGIALFDSGVSPLIVNGLVDHVNEVYLQNKALAIGGNIDVNI